ncbi:MAG: hypothetical protein HW411_1720 [Gammaproteobacteria bacterium]|nr:hypothetical protein [Gammaproteobacteria bacterium]
MQCGIQNEIRGQIYFFDRCITQAIAEEEILLVYDKECPACDAYCRLVRIRDSVGRLKLINARDSGEIMDEITMQGLDIDQGMVLKLDKQLYYGSECHPRPGAHQQQIRFLQSVELLDV